MHEQSHEFSGDKEGRNFRLSITSNFLTVVQFYEKESRNFELSFSLVHNFSVESTQKPR